MKWYQFNPGQWIAFLDQVWHGKPILGNMNHIFTLAIHLNVVLHTCDIFLRRHILMHIYPSFLIASEVSMACLCLPCWTYWIWRLAIEWFDIALIYRHIFLYMQHCCFAMTLLYCQHWQSDQKVPKSKRLFGTYIYIRSQESASAQLICLVDCISVSLTMWMWQPNYQSHPAPCLLFADEASYRRWVAGTNVQLIQSKILVS